MRYEIGTKFSFYIFASFVYVYCNLDIANIMIFDQFFLTW